MKFSIVLLGVALYLLSPAEAGISTNTPFNTVVWNGGETEKVVWVDDGKAPKLAQIGVTTIDLMMGNSTSQVLIANIGKVPATAKQIDYKVPEDVGPSGDNYFIKYTAGTYTAFSGTFSIEGINGEAPTPAGPKVPKDPFATPGATTPNAATPNAATPNAAVPKAAVPNATTPKATDPKAVTTPKSTSSSPSASPTAQNNLPEPISNASSNLFPSFSGVAAAALAFAFTYLY